MNYVYSFDHGNRYIKTLLGPNPEGRVDSDIFLDTMDVEIFQHQAGADVAREARKAIRFMPVGLAESDTKPTSFENDLLRYNGKYYTASDRRIPYMMDKTIDNRYYILTIMALAKKHLREFPHYREDSVIPVTMLIGLPPDHYMSLYESYENYFLSLGRECDFLFNDIGFSLKIDEVRSYIQAHAAVAPIMSDVRLIPRSLVIDIGGYTVDLLQLVFGKPNTDVCMSLEDFGAIQFYNLINDRIKKSYNTTLPEDEIDRVLSSYPRMDMYGNLTTEPTEHDNLDKLYIELILKEADQYISDLFSKLREMRIDLKSYTPIFVGGGSILFRKMIDKYIGVHGIKKFRYVNSIRANTDGYLKLYQAEKMAGR